MTKLEKAILDGIEVIREKYPQYLGTESMLLFLMGYCESHTNEKVVKALKKYYLNYETTKLKMEG